LNLIASGLGWMLMGIIVLWLVPPEAMIMPVALCLIAGITEIVRGSLVDPFSVYSNGILVYTVWGERFVPWRRFTYKEDGNGRRALLLLYHPVTRNGRKVKSRWGLVTLPGTMPHFDSLVGYIQSQINCNRNTSHS